MIGAVTAVAVRYNGIIEGAIPLNHNVLGLDRRRETVMSGILAIAPLFAFLTCGAVWLVFRIYRRRFPSAWMSRLGCAIPILLFPFATVGSFVGLTNAMTETGTNATP